MRMARTSSREDSGEYRPLTSPPLAIREQARTSLWGDSGNKVRVLDTPTAPPPSEQGEQNAR